MLMNLKMFSLSYIFHTACNKINTSYAQIWHTISWNSYYANDSLWMMNMVWAAYCFLSFYSFSFYFHPDVSQCVFDSSKMSNTALQCAMDVMESVSLMSNAAWRHIGLNPSLITHRVGVTHNLFINLSVRDVSEFDEYLLYLWNHIPIWQVSPQLSCGDTCQIWMWYSKPVFWWFWKFGENNDIEEICEATPPFDWGGSYKDVFFSQVI